MSATTPFSLFQVARFAGVTSSAQDTCHSDAGTTPLAGFSPRCAESPPPPGAARCLAAQHSSPCGEPFAFSASRSVDSDAFHMKFVITIIAFRRFLASAPLICLYIGDIVPAGFSR